MLRIPFHKLRLPIALLFVTLSTASVQAQYFGQNQIRRKSFNFRVLKTEHFDIYYYPQEEEAVQLAARMAERWYGRLSRVLDFEFTDRQPLILYSSQPDFQQTNTVGGVPGEGTGGVTEAFKRRIVLPFGGPLEDTDHVIGHELVHAFQYAITSQGHPGAGFREPALSRLPLWFIEGMAEYLSIGPVDTQTAMWMRDAVIQDKLPPIKKLDDTRYFPYRWGHAFWAYVAGRFGDPIVGRILKATGKNNTVEDALKEVLAIKADDLSEQWHTALKSAYQPSIESGQKLADVARPLIQHKEGDTHYYVGPALSPDGERIAFYSERDLFSIDIFVADADSGKVSERLSHTAVDAHFDSLQFIKSAGAWDRQGKRFVVAVVSEGRPALSIIDVARNTTEREIRLPELGEVQTPDFSPDGRKIVFSGIAGGFVDLFIYDLDQDQLQRLTHDPFAEIHPAWSPDGKSIAYVTDRYSADLKNLSFGDFQLALMDVASHETKPLPAFGPGKSINPQWSADGSSLFFVSDRDGIANIYRFDLKQSAFYRITELPQGVSGITDLSPAISVSSAADTLAFTTFAKSGYTIQIVEDAAKLTGSPVSSAPVEGASSSLASLPPAERVGNEILALRKNPQLGLPAEQRFPTQSYKPSLSLDYVAQPYLAGGVDRFGTYIGGGTSLYFSDMLGNHNLGLTFQAQGDLNDIAFIAGYTNLSSRWNWGMSAGQVPYRTGGYGVYQTQGAYVEETYVSRQINRVATTYVAYPFNRVKRAELMAGYRNISFDDKIYTDYYDPITGSYLGEEKQDLPSAKALNLAETSMAFVHDTSIFGATGPLLGSRYRFEVGQTLGSINYTSLLGDYRQYIMPVRPFTIAARLLHYGRYGSGAADTRMLPLFIGYSTLVHGYDTGSFSAAECGTGDSTCPVFDQLLGERILVGNLELRFPLLGLLGGRRFYGPLPIDMALFFDAGVAWTSQDKPSIFGGDRDFVKSVGAAARLNFFGFAVVEAAYVNPLDRPGKKAFWQFGFSPSF